MLETRSINLNELRADPENPRRLSGMACVYGQLADLGKFQERFNPGSLAKAIAAEPNILALWEHDRRSLLASTQAGSMELRDTPEGLSFTMTVADTTTGRDVLALVAAGELRGMSFGFAVAPQGQRFHREAGVLVRDITEVARFPEITITVAPAYTGTSVSQRSIDPAAIAEAERMATAPDYAMRMHTIRQLRAAM